MSRFSYSRRLRLSSGDTIPVTIESTDRSGVYNFDILYLMDWMKNNYSYPRWRIYVLNPDETINYEIPNEDIKIGGSFSENYQDGQRKSLSFSLYNESGKYSPNINNFWANTRLRLDMGLDLVTGETVWFQAGIYVISNAQNSLSPSEKAVQITAKDKFSLFEDKTGTLEGTYEIPVGSDIEEVIKTILLGDMGNGYPFDNKPIIYHSSLKGKKTQSTISKSAGETYGSILLDLAVQLSAEIFYNSQGYLTLMPTNEASHDLDKTLLYDFVAEDGDMGGLDFSFDMNSIINKIVVVGSSVKGQVVSAVAVNDDASSPLSYQKIGYRTGNVINDSNITTEYLAQERAQYELRKQLILKSSTTISIPFNPLLSVNNLIAITSNYFNLSHERFLIQSISCSLDYSNVMSVTITNVKNLPSIIEKRV